MSKSGAAGNRRSAANRVRHSKADALTEREFELLLEGANRLRPPYAREAKFCILVMGKMGLRLGELTHLRESWIDWRHRRISIPHHEPCTEGSDGGLCSLCTQQMRQQLAHNPNLERDDVRPQMWRAKTRAASREISFSHDPRLELAVERHFEEWDRWMYSHSAIRRRIKRSAEEADGLSASDVYPHCLRATCASRLAAKGLSGLELKGILGWATLQTSENYVATSPEKLDRALHQAHSR